MEQIIELDIAVLERGYYQPRDYFDPLAMESTKRSIQEKGQKYPVIVRTIVPGNPLYDASWSQTHYELADGERRYRCCKELGFTQIKALVRDLSDEEMLDYTLTTNDSLPLNPIEKAQVFSRLAKDFKKSQSEIAASFNLKQQQVSEYIRLLELPKEVQDLTARAVISVRHARELLKLADQESIKTLALEVEKKAITTRQLTKILKNDDKNRLITTKIEKELIQLSDISFSSLSKVENSSKKSNIMLPNAGRRNILAPLDHLNAFFIPSKLHLRMELWLNLDLGSRDRPERWLSKLELSLLGGALVSLTALLLPQALSLTLLAVLGSLMVYLFIF